MTTEAIARVAHCANRALCIAHGDLSQQSWETAPPWQHISTAESVEFLSRHPGASAVMLHEKRVVRKRGDGWRWGPVKDVAEKRDPCLVGWDELPELERAKDRLFLAVVRALLEEE